MGQIAYLLGKKIKTLKYDRALGWLALPVLLIYISATQSFYTGGISYTNAVRPWLFYLMLVGAVPILFAASHRSTIDRFLGDLSYPVYVCHFLIIALAIHFLGADYFASSWIVLIGVLLTAMGLLVLIERPVSKLRADIATAQPNNDLALRTT